MRKSIKKFPAFIIFLLCMICLNSCGSNRISFSPEKGGYEIMLNEKSWEAMESQNIYQLVLLYQDNPGLLLVIDYYPKEYMADLSVTDFDNFIKFYKTLEVIMNVYEGENNSVHELINVEKKDIKGSPVISGKRQQISIKNPDRESVTEYIFLETADYYFAMAYNANTEDIGKAQGVVNDVIKKLKVSE